jgi:hypothetical protein
MRRRAALLLGPKSLHTIQSHIYVLLVTYTYYWPERIGNDARALTMLRSRGAPNRARRRGRLVWGQPQDALRRVQKYAAVSNPIHLRSNPCPIQSTSDSLTSLRRDSRLNKDLLSATDATRLTDLIRGTWNIESIIRHGSPAAVAEEASWIAVLGSPAPTANTAHRQEVIL